MKKLFLMVMLIASVAGADAQILDRVIDRTKEKTKAKGEQKTDETIDKGLNKVEESISDIFKKKDKKAKAGTSKSQPGQSTAKGNDTDFSEYKSFDFIPGKTVIFFDNFADRSISRWKFYDPNYAAVSTYDGNNWMELRGTRFAPINVGVLPDDVTVEFDAYVLDGKQPCGSLEINFVEQSQKDQLEDPWLDNASTITISPITETPKNATISYEKKKDNEILGSTMGKGFTTWQPELGNTLARISIARKGTKVSVYVNNEKLLDNIDMLNAGMKYMLAFNLQNYFVEETRMYLTNIRIASGGTNAVNDVKAQGKFVTNTIYFDVNSARIKPESWATLKQSADAIKSNPGTFLIVGHTDSDGADDANFKLSQSRADSVKAVLVKEFGVDATRLTTDGKGESQPVTSNNTAAGKAQNRRVEFIKK